MGINYGSLPFREQIDFFLNKIPVPTRRWHDLQREAHDTGFMVAGAMKADLLADLQEAVRKAIEDGVTLREFRQDFDAIVAKRGWTGWTGSDTDAGVAWRTRLIYETNLRNAYNAGRWQQIQAVKKYRPYLIYRHSDSVTTPRPLHLAWDGLVLPVDHPWWQTHAPANGYGCKCSVETLSESDLQKMGKTGPDTAPDDGDYDWTDPKTGETHSFPNGVDPFWDYAPGASVAKRVQEQIERKLPGLPDPIAKQLKADIKANTQQAGTEPASASQAKTKTQEDNFNKARDFVLKFGRDMQKNNQAGIEFAYVYDETGKVLIKRRGVIDKIKFTTEDIAKMQEAKGVIIVHNHPGDGWSLSENDLLFSHHVDAEVYAITHHEGVYYSGQALDIGRLKTHYQIIHSRTVDLMDNLIVDAKLSVAAADFYEFHLLNAVLAGLDIIRYSATGITYRLPWRRCLHN